MKTIFFVIFKFGHHTENSLIHLYGTGIVCMKDVILQTGYQMTPKSPVQSKTRTAQTICTAHQITLLVIRDSKQCWRWEDVSAFSQALALVPAVHHQCRNTHPVHLHPSSGSRCFPSPILPCCFLLGLQNICFQRRALSSPTISGDFSFPFLYIYALVNENQHEWSQLCPHLRCRYAQTPGSQDLIWSENPHSQCILKTEPQSQSIGTIQILAVSG